MLGFDGLMGLALVVAIGVAVVGGVETFDSVLETRRGAVAALEPGAMIFGCQIATQGGLAALMGGRGWLVLCYVGKSPGLATGKLVRRRKAKVLDDYRLAFPVMNAISGRGNGFIVACCYVGDRRRVRGNGGDGCGVNGMVAKDKDWFGPSCSKMEP